MILAVVFNGIALADSYSFVTLDVPGGTNTAAHGINSAGQIVGTYTGAGGTLGFLYNGGNFSAIAMPGAIVTHPSGINSAGQIVGFYDVAGNGSHNGFLYLGGTFSIIDVPGASTTQALAINDAGQIVGAYTDAAGEHGFLCLGGTFTSLDVPGAISTSARAIDNAGEIVGTYTDANSLAHGFLYAGGAFSEVGPGQDLIRGVNDADQIVGIPGFLYIGGILSPIDVPGAAGGTDPEAINDAGQIAGFYSDVSGAIHGFFATPTVQPALMVSNIYSGTGTFEQRQAAAAYTTASAGHLTSTSSAGACDVNGNGVTNVADVQFLINQALGATRASNDLNGDGAVNVADIQVVINAVLNLGCTPVGSAAGSSSVAHLTVQSGNGQVLCVLPSCTLQSWQPISVKATDASGNPVAGATVSWTVTEGFITLGGPTSTTSVTGSNGIATQSLSEVIFEWQVAGFTSYNVNKIQATSSNISVTFVETQALQDGSTSAIEAEPPQFNGSGLGDAPLSAPTGTTLGTPIMESVAGLDQASQGVENIAVRIINQQSSPTLTCVTEANADPGSVLTDDHGNASCTPIFSGTGTGTYYLTIGGVAGGSVGNGALYFAALGPLTFTSVPDAPAAVPIAKH
jgi:probable HAF family extracellular repeat protein